jgi:hypothetical protein
MKKIIIILIAIFSYTLCFSQTIIHLKIVPFEIKNQDFYIDKVFDDRQEILLGFIDNKKLYFESDADITVKEFIDNILPKTNDKIPIVLRINILKIEQEQTSIEGRTARVYIDLGFYAESGEELYKIAHYEDQEFLLSDLMETSETHEQRVRAALEYCLRSFINHQKASTSHNLVKNRNIDNVSGTVEDTKFQTYVPLGKWFNMVTFTRTRDKYNEGWNVAYTGFLDHENDLIIPFTLAYGQSRGKLDLVRERGYSSVNAYALGFGFNSFIKIIPGLYVDLGLNVPIGMEVLRDLANKRTSNFLIGLGSHQGVKIIPWKDFGIVIGAGLFQRWQTSKIEKRNFGFELEIGINF